MKHLNNKIPKPSNPNPVNLTEQSCEVCQTNYKDFRPGYTWDDAKNLYESANTDNPTAHRSRGPILWAWRCLKLEYWFYTHSECTPSPGTE